MLRDKWEDPEFVQYRDAFPADARASPEALEAHVRDLTERDVKIASLKNLQGKTFSSKSQIFDRRLSNGTGYLWQEGYESGAYSTPLFDDVLPAMQRWQESGIQCSIYSSGSVFAQKLLFGHIKDADAHNSKSTLDRRDLIEEWFDTVNAGPKTQSASYEKIAAKLDKDTKKILFLSDNVKEIQAAIETDMRAMVVDRPGNAEIPKEDRTIYGVVTSFEQIKL